MKTEITLEELLKQITPLPYLSIRCSSAAHGPNTILIKQSLPVGRGIAGVRWMNDALDDEDAANAAYLTHCANVLPELVKAVKAQEKKIGRLNHHDMQMELNSVRKALRQALSRAEKVTLT